MSQGGTYSLNTMMSPALPGGGSETLIQLIVAQHYLAEDHNGSNDIRTALPGGGPAREFWSDERSPALPGGGSNSNIDPMIVAQHYLAEDHYGSN